MDYGRLGSAEPMASLAEPPPPSSQPSAAKTSKKRKFLLLFLISSLFLLASGISAFVLVRARTRGSATSQPILANRPTQAISRTCGQTRFPSLCIDSLVNFPGALQASETDLVHISVNMTLQRVGRALYGASSLSAVSMDTRLRAAYEDCLELLEDSVDQLSQSLSSVAGGGRTDDVLTWLSAALTNQDTCDEGLADVSGSVKNQMAARLKDLTELVSNCLAIFALANHNKEFSGIPIQNRRRLMADGSFPLRKSGFPKWLKRRDRWLLQMPPAAIRADIVVSQDGNGTYKTLTEAIKAAPQQSNRRTIIYVKAGSGPAAIMIGWDDLPRAWKLVLLRESAALEFADESRPFKLFVLKSMNDAAHPIYGSILISDVAVLNVRAHEESHASLDECTYVLYKTYCYTTHLRTAGPTAFHTRSFCGAHGLVVKMLTPRVGGWIPHAGLSVDADFRYFPKIPLSPEIYLISPFSCFVRYDENLKVGRKKTNLMFIGDGKGKTVIQGSRSVHDNYTTFHTATFGKARLPSSLFLSFSFHLMLSPSFRLILTKFEEKLNLEGCGFELERTNDLTPTVPEGSLDNCHHWPNFNGTLVNADNLMFSSEGFQAACHSTFVMDGAATGMGFIARDMTFQNWAGPSKHQAVALRVGADHAVVYRCSVIGYQDTLYVHSQRQFFREVDVYGTVDFIFGNAAVVFQNCSIYARKPMPMQKNTITAQNRKDPNQNTGISIHNCRLYAQPDLEAAKSSFPTYLGRPWKLYSRVVYLMTYMGDHIHPAGWLEWNATFALDTLYYGEYMNYGPGGAVGQRVKWPGFHVITAPEEARKFTVAQFIYGSSWLPSTGVAFIAGLSL
ncbi:hypothetical protein ACLOJK_010250 [Asimina triloba]